MWKIVLLLSLLPISLVWLLRQYFSGAAWYEGKRSITALSVNQLREELGLPGKNNASARADASTLGDALRQAGLELLEKEGHPLAKRCIRQGMLVKIFPVLAAMVGGLAILARRISTGWVLAGAALAIALLMLSRFQSVAIQMQGMGLALKRLQQKRFFHRPSEEALVMAAAKASIWRSLWPWGG
jgi:cytochrome c-type biogenesis protein CcmH/NrfG